jgi:hypothetical protein
MIIRHRNWVGATPETLVVLRALTAVSSQATDDLLKLRGRVAYVARRKIYRADHLTLGRDAGTPHAAWLGPRSR